MAQRLGESQDHSRAQGASRSPCREHGLQALGSGCPGSHLQAATGSEGTGARVNLTARKSRRRERSPLRNGGGPAEGGG